MPSKKSSNKAKSTLIANVQKDNLYTKFKSLENFSSIFDVLHISKPRFIQLYDKALAGEAGKIYDWAMYYANYIAHHYRAGGRTDTAQQVFSSASV